MCFLLGNKELLSSGSVAVAPRPHNTGLELLCTWFALQHGVFLDRDGACVSRIGRTRILNHCTTEKLSAQLRSIDGMKIFPEKWNLQSGSEERSFRPPTS